MKKKKWSAVILDINLADSNDTVHYARKLILWRAYNLRSKVENCLKEMWFGIQLNPVIIPSISDRQYSLQSVKAKQYVASTK